MPQRADLRQTYQRLVERETHWHDSKSCVWGVATPFAGVNTLTGGIQPGVTVLGARTTHGKSAMGMQLVFHAAMEIYAEWQAMPNPGAEPPAIIPVYSPEMTAIQLMERYATMMSRVPTNLIRTGAALDHQREDWLYHAQSMIEIAPIIRLIAGQRISYHEIVDDLENWSTQYEIRFAFVDYLQRVGSSDLGHVGGVEHLTRVMNEFQGTAARLEIPLLVASQLNRAIERDAQTSRDGERPPELSDLKGSGAIEEDADTVLLLWRPPKATPPVTPKGTPTARSAKLYVAKNRNGAVGEKKLVFYPDILLFADDGEELVNGSY